MVPVPYQLKGLQYEERRGDFHLTSSGPHPLRAVKKFRAISHSSWYHNDYSLVMVLVLVFYLSREWRSRRRDGGHPGPPGGRGQGPDVQLCILFI